MTPGVIYVALVLSIVSFVFSVAAFIVALVRGRPPAGPAMVSPWNDELLTRDACLEEIEARGEAVLQRIERAEQRLAARRAEPAFVSEKRRQPVEPETDPETSASLQHPDVRAQVRRLADQGYDVTDIARRLQLGRGEVELFLGLPGVRRSPDDG